MRATSAEVEREERVQCEEEREGIVRRDRVNRSAKRRERRVKRTTYERERRGNKTQYMQKHTLLFRNILYHSQIASYMKNLLYHHLETHYINKLIISYKNILYFSKKHAMKLISITNPVSVDSFKIFFY